MNSRKMFFGLALLGLVLGSTAANAQLTIQPGHPSGEAYRVRVVNEMGVPIRVKIMSYDHHNYFQADLGRGQSHAYPLWAGDRVVCVWDNRSGDVILTSPLVVDRPGILRLQSFFEMPGGPVPRGAAPRGAAPKGAAPRSSRPGCDIADRVRVGLRSQSVHFPELLDAGEGTDDAEGVFGHELQIGTGCENRLLVEMTNGDDQEVMRLADIDFTDRLPDERALRRNPHFLDVHLGNQAS